MYFGANRKSVKGKLCSMQGYLISGNKGRTVEAKM
jgi:hypothetical protein